MNLNVDFSQLQAYGNNVIFNENINRKLKNHDDLKNSDREILKNEFIEQLRKGEFEEAAEFIFDVIDFLEDRIKTLEKK